MSTVDEIKALEEQLRQAQAVHKLKFMRVWLKKNGVWQIIAGSISPNDD